MKGRRDWLVIGLVIVAVVSIVPSLFILLFVYPKFIACLEELGVQEFPLPMLMLMKASHFMTSKWWVGALCLLMAYAGIALAKRTSTGRAYWERIARHRRQVRIALAAVGAFVGLIAMLLIVLSMVLPMIAMRAQLAAGP